jgi:hypothetical protein
MAMTHAAMFLDRDGVINVNRDHYVKSWAEFEFLPASLPALRRLATFGLPVVVWFTATGSSGDVDRSVAQLRCRRCRHRYAGCRPIFVKSGRGNGLLTRLVKQSARVSMWRKTWRMP